MLTRREMLQNGLAVPSAVGIEGEVDTISARNPQAFVVSVQGRISPEARERFKMEWDRIYQGTGLAGVPVMLLSEGATLTVIDKVPAAAACSRRYYRGSYDNEICVDCGQPMEAHGQMPIV